MGNDDERWDFWWTNGPKLLMIAILSFVAGLFTCLAINLAKDTGERSAMPSATTRQACARLLADAATLNGERARASTATVRQVCAEIEAADVDIVPGPVLTIPGVGGGL